MLFYGLYIFLTILLYYSIIKLKCKHNSTDLFFDQYSPKHDLITIPQILNSYNELLYSLHKEKSISIFNFFKVFELLTIHVLINWIVETLEENDESKKIKNHVRILNLIDKYTNIFVIEDFYLQELKISFIYKLIESLKHLNQENIFLVYKYIENIYVDNVYFHSYIKTPINFNPYIETLSLNSLKLQFYIDFLKTKNINFLQYI
jgi:hypothetical protein